MIDYYEEALKEVKKIEEEVDEKYRKAWNGEF